MSSGKYVEVYRQWNAFAQRVKRTEDEPQTVKHHRRKRRRH